MKPTYHATWDNGDFASHSAASVARVANALRHRAPRLWVAKQPAEDKPLSFRDVAMRRTVAATAKALVAKARAPWAIRWEGWR